MTTRLLPDTTRMISAADGYKPRSHGTRVCTLCRIELSFAKADTETLERELAAVTGERPS